MFGFIRRWRRKGLLEEPFPDAWMEFVDRLEFVGEIPDDEVGPFLDHLKVFFHEKVWVPAGGFEEVTLEMKVVVSACAARLVRQLPLDAYQRLTEVVMYPASFSLGAEDEREVLGLAHHWGTVVLAWDAVRRGISVPNDGHDTAIHEFAHALDIEDGLYDGTPLLDSAAHYRDWVRVLGSHFSRMQDAPSAGVLRPYGATNEAEFFAVATEAFFERPKKLHRKAPDLYEQLHLFYLVDPAGVFDDRSH